MSGPSETHRLLGHAEAEATLLQAWNSGRLPHAWLLSGPRGIGKATLAYRFAGFVLAEGMRTSDGGAGLFAEASALAEGLQLPEDHPVTRQVAAGSHPDLFVLEPGQPHPETGKLSQQIGVGHVRKTTHALQMTPSSSAWRVLIVDPVEAMNINAANALLKALEEPPAQALLLLISHAPGSLLPTIRSRCCQLAMPALEEAVILDLLAEQAPDLSAEDRLTLARLSDGSIGRALALHEAGGIDFYRTLVALLASLPRKDPRNLHLFADSLGQAGEGGRFQVGSDLIVWWLARLLRAGASGRLPQEAVAGEGEVMQRLLARRHLAQWLALWEKVSRLFSLADRSNLDRRQAVLSAMLELDRLAG